MNNIYNLTAELEIERRLLDRLRRYRVRILVKQSPAGYPEGQSYLDADTIRGSRNMGFTDALDELDRIDGYIAEQEKNIARIEQDIQEITKLVDSLTGLEQKVKYMQLVQGMSLREIAGRLNYNESYIRRVSTQKR